MGGFTLDSVPGENGLKSMSSALSTQIPLMASTWISLAPSSLTFPPTNWSTTCKTLVFVKSYMASKMEV